MGKLKLDDQYNSQQYQQNLLKAEKLGFKGSNASNFALNQTAQNLQYDAGELPEISVTPGVRKQVFFDNGVKNIHSAAHTAAHKESDISKASALAIGAPMATIFGAGVVAPTAAEAGVGKTISTVMNNPWVQRGFAADGVRNFVSDNGVLKTYRIGKDIYDNGLTARKALDFTKSAVGDVLDIAGGIGTTVNDTRRFFDWRFKNIILPEHQKGILFLNKEIIPARLGRSLSETELFNFLNKNVDRYRLFGKNRTPFTDFLDSMGYATVSGKIRYNPLTPKRYIAPSAVHEGTHLILFSKPAINDEFGITTINKNTGSFEELDSFIPYKKKVLLNNGTVLPDEAKYNPETGEYLFREYDPKRDLEFTVDNNGKIHKRLTKTEKEDFADNYGLDHAVDLHRRSILSQAFPIRQYRIGKKEFFLAPNSGSTSASAMERDATLTESLYELSRKHNGVTGSELNFLIQNASDKELTNILKNGNGYGNDYVWNWRFNRLLRTKPPIDKFRLALLMRKSGGKLNYLNYINNVG